MLVILLVVSDVVVRREVEGVVKLPVGVLIDMVGRVVGVVRVPLSVVGRREVVGVLNVPDGIGNVLRLEVTGVVTPPGGFEKLPDGFLRVLKLLVGVVNVLRLKVGVLSVPLKLKLRLEVVGVERELGVRSVVDGMVSDGMLLMVGSDLLDFELRSSVVVLNFGVVKDDVGVLIRGVVSEGVEVLNLEEVEIVVGLNVKPGTVKVYGWTVNPGMVDGNVKVILVVPATSSFTPPAIATARALITWETRVAFTVPLAFVYERALIWVPIPRELVTAFAKSIVWLTRAETLDVSWSFDVLAPVWTFVA